MGRPPELWSYKRLRIKHFHRVSSGNQRPYLLKSRYGKVSLFARYESAGNFRTKHLLAEQVFTELELHAQLEENVFYSAYDEMTGKNGTQLVADSRLAHKHVRALMSCGCPPSASGPPPQKGLEVTVWLLDSLRAGSL